MQPYIVLAVQVRLLAGCQASAKEPCDDVRPGLGTLHIIMAVRPRLE
jgi:hypothetical protein